MHVLHFGWCKVVRETFEFQSGAPAEDQVVSEKRLEGDNRLLPGKSSSGALIDLPQWMVQPPGAHILAAQ